MAEHFLVGIRKQEGQLGHFTPADLTQLAGCHWPGNVRELCNAVQRAYVMASDLTFDETWLRQSAAAMECLKTLYNRLEEYAAEEARDTVQSPLD